MQHLVWKEQNLTITQLTTADAKRLSVLANRAYLDHYTHLWENSDTTWYREKSFNVTQLQHELSDDNARFFIATDGAEDLGFLKVNLFKPLSIENVAPPIFTNTKFNIAEIPNALELERIYLTKSAQYRGIGRRLTELSFDLARARGHDAVWLKVMDTNDDTIRFYEKMGFEKCGAMMLNFEKMKPILRGMFLMKKTLI